MRSSNTVFRTGGHTLIRLALCLATIPMIDACATAPIQTAAAAPTAAGKHLYMDIHKHVDGLTAEAVAGAHQKDLAIQGKYGVNYVSYWFNEDTGAVFCLVEAPSADLASRVHREAHGLVADEIVEVNRGH